MGIDKLRFRFRKSGDLRFLSHHDLMRVVERLLRRADIPFRSSSGFNPRPRLVFPLSLPLGIVGCREVMELELREPRDPEETRQALLDRAPNGLEFLSCGRIAPKMTGQVIQADYRLPLPSDRVEEIARRCENLLRQREVLVERSQPQAKLVDIRPYILNAQVAWDLSPMREPSAPPFLTLNLRVTPSGSARASEVIRWLGAADLLEAGAILERTNLLLLDELPVSDSDPPPKVLSEGSDSVRWLEPAAPASPVPAVPSPSKDAL